MSGKRVVNSKLLREKLPALAPKLSSERIAAAVCRELREVLNIAGYRLSILSRRDERGVKREYWHDDEAGIDYVLVPSGTYRAQLTDARRSAIAGWVGGESEIVVECVAPVAVGPMLVAVTPLLCTAPAYARFASPETRSTKPFPAVCARLTREAAALVSETWGWSIPSFAESAWAAHGGLTAIFPWGDELYPWVVSGADHETYVELQREHFPIGAFAGEPVLPARRNGYGLLDCLSMDTWLDDGRTHGGTGMLVPWQSHDWLLSVIDERPHEPWEGGRSSLRPVIRLT